MTCKIISFSVLFDQKKISFHNVVHNTTPAAAIAMDVTNESQWTSDVIVLDYTPTLSSSLL